MKRGPTIKASGAGEMEAFSKRYRRHRAKFSKAGEYSYWKTRYQRRARRLAKCEVRKEASEGHEDQR